MTEQPTPNPTTQVCGELADGLSDDHMTERIEDVPASDLATALPDGRPLDVYRDAWDGRRYGRHPWGFTIGYDETNDRAPLTDERRTDGIEGN